MIVPVEERIRWEFRRLLSHAVRDLLAFWGVACITVWMWKHYRVFAD